MANPLSSGRTWRFRGDPAFRPSAAQVEAAGGSALVAKLLIQRGVQTPEAMRQFLNGPSAGLSSGLELPDAEQAVARILEAREKEEPVLIYGDFDVDGQTGTSIFYQTLKHLGMKVSYYVPDRVTEGHGLHTAALCRLVSSRQLKLVITTDTGITNFTEISLLNGLGVDTVITDHHALPENLPPAVASVNPQRLPADHPLAFLCGAGVAYKVCELLLEATGEDASLPPEDLLDLVAVGTVADLVPLQRENRALVRQGLEVLNRRQRAGLRHILAQAAVAPETPLTSETVGFTIGPRLNAIGRLANATEAVELLTTTDEARAEALAARLEQLNRKRKDLCDQTFLEAEQFLSMSGGLAGRKSIVLASPDWLPGIVGIVASRLIDKYHVPTLLMTVDEAAQVAKCSARSIPDFHLHDALSELSGYFLNFGGHAGAAGFSLPLAKLEAFKADWYRLTNAQITDAQTVPLAWVDDTLSWSQLTPQLIDLLEAMAPFGQENPSPKFMLERVTLGAQRLLGDSGRHLKLVLLPPDDASKPIDALLWNHGLDSGGLDAQHRYDLLVSVERNTYGKPVNPVRLVVDHWRQSPVAGQAPLMNTATNTVTSTVQVSRPPAASLPISPSSLSSPSRPAAAGGPSQASAPTSTTATAQPLGLSEGPQWVDHRRREDLSTFVSQLLLPTATSQTMVLFHEGRAPAIPFLDPQWVRARHQLQPAEALIFWDLPPDEATLRHILKQVQPTVVHWAGGKYHTVPLFPQPKDFIRLIYQATRPQAVNIQEGGEVLLQPARLATTLGTTPSVILAGLVLLQQMGHLQCSLPEAAVPLSASAAETALLVRRCAPEADLKTALATTTATEATGAATLLFRQALGQVSQFRSWLLQTPLQHVQHMALLEDPWLETYAIAASVLDSTLDSAQAASGVSPALAKTLPEAVRVVAAV
ncbi:MAG: single-stranded-DNA-specific exonuclease RecJ [Candidatus Melainabacteria bacterium]|nr:single-stranded-DNA-specific exonuclease RecJ [Candidatus Melainabacteria bacterium]